MMSSRVFRENLIIGLISILIFAFAIHYEAFEQLTHFSATHEDWEVDEIFTLLMISSFALLFALYRKKQHLKNEYQRRTAAEKEISRLAFYDNLTGLPRRNLCENRLEHLLQQANRYHKQVIVMFIDLDNFKDINESFGHKFGDDFLVQVALRLSKNLRASDTLCRISGDEFLLILESSTQPTDAGVLAEKLIAELSQTIVIDGHKLNTSVSIGIATYPNDGDNASELTQRADMAMSQAKKDGKSTYRFYSEHLHLQTQTKRKIRNALKSALTNNEFTLVYQPIINLKDLSIIGAEALLRWNSSELGNIPPDVFIPIAENCGLISPIGDWVLQQACAQTKQWHLEGNSEFIISVNMSAKQLAQGDYFDKVCRTLEETKLAPRFLELELTETSIMKNIQLSIEQLEKIKSLGIAIAIDDFGTGYSSMNYLTKLKIDRIKIDRSFISGVTQDHESSIMTKAMTALANNLNLDVTAEGIETLQQLKFLLETTCNHAQGYYFSKPISAENFSKILLTEPRTE